MTIHKTDGTIVRRVLDSDLVGTEGAVAWDGRDGDGYRVIPGQYIALLECVDATSSRVHRERCVIVVGE